MENYDPEFNNIVKQGDIVIAKYNFGTGSSREQAVTAFKYRGISLLLAGSFSETYMRNAFNNGYICIEVPQLIEDLTRILSNPSALTLRTGKKILIDFENSLISMDNQHYPISPFGEAIQEVILAGGLESWIRTQIIQ